jgi:hypothetical protein
MKLFLLILLSLSCFLPTTPLLAAKHKLSTGMGLNYIKYEEPGLMELSGFLYEGQINSRQISDQHLYEVDASLQVGSLDYDGQTMEEGIPVKTESDDLIANLAFYRGLYYTRRENTGENYIFAGLAGRYWFNDLKNTSIANGYTRQITYLYLPVGMEISNYLSNGWQHIIRLEYRIFLQGKVHSQLSEAGFRDDATNKQTSGSGLRAKMQWKNPQYERDCYDIGLALDYWDIDDSNTDSVIRIRPNEPDLHGEATEPANTTLTLSAFANFYF